MASTPLLRIGTRGSPLALAQAAEARRRLAEAEAALAVPGAMATVVIRTTGDRVQDRSLADIGGKGLFTKEIDEALLSERIDVAVHSVKDVPTWLPGGIRLACVLAREDPRDVLISRRADSIAALPARSVVGTASPRRQAQVLHRRPDLRVVPLRGNVETRLAKLDQGRADATLLALAGLRRLDLVDAASAVIETSEILPAVGQGAIGITCRTGDERVRALLAALDDADTSRCVGAERAMLEALGGSCRTPIAGLAEASAGGGLHLRGLVARADGSELIETARRGAAADAVAMGRDAGEELLRRAGPSLLGWVG